MLVVAMLLCVTMPLFAQSAPRNAGKTTRTFDHRLSEDELAALRSMYSTLDSLDAEIYIINDNVNNSNRAFNRPSNRRNGPDSGNQHSRPDGNRQNMRGGFFGQSSNGNPRLARLNLTAEQTKKIDTIYRNHQKDMIDKRATIQKLQIDKQAAEAAENTSQVKRLIDDISKAEADIEKARVDLEQNILKELTAEQKEQYKQAPSTRFLGRD